MRHYFDELIGWAILMAFIGGIIEWGSIVSIGYGGIILAGFVLLVIDLGVSYYILKKLVYGILESAGIQAHKTLTRSSFTGFLNRHVFKHERALAHKSAGQA